MTATVKEAWKPGFTASQGCLEALPFVRQERRRAPQATPAQNNYNTNILAWPFTLFAIIYHNLMNWNLTSPLEADSIIPFSHIRPFRKASYLSAHTLSSPRITTLLLSREATRHGAPPFEASSSAGAGAGRAPHARVRVQRLSGLCMDAPAHRSTGGVVCQTRTDSQGLS